MSRSIPHEWLKHDYYAVLGVPASASQDDIGRAYRSNVREAHPDVGGGEQEATERFELLSAARATLSDPAVRAAYDQVRRAARLEPHATPEPSAAASSPRPPRPITRRHVPGYVRPGPTVWIPDRTGGTRDRRQPW